MDAPPALPSMAQPGQRIRLPGQARVDPAEYREFLMLGHGGVFDLDVDACAPDPTKGGTSHTARAQALLQAVHPQQAGCAPLCPAAQGCAPGRQSAAPSMRPQQALGPAQDRPPAVQALPRLLLSRWSPWGKPARPSCRVVDAPWRSYAANYQDFFNYDLNMWAWKEYAKRVQLHRVESAMQRKIQTFTTPQAGSQPRLVP